MATLSFRFHILRNPVAFNACPRRLSSFFIRTPPRTAPREAPTPLVFVSASSWQPESLKGLKSLSVSLAKKGFTCIESDLSLPEQSVATSEELMSYFEDKLKQDIRLSSMIFPPVIFARGAGALIAQTYISSNPASGLILISPPPTNKLVSADLMPSELPEFDYEPQFPLAIVDSRSGMQAYRENSRFGQDPDVDLLEVDDVDGAKGSYEIQQWLDEIGV